MPERSKDWIWQAERDLGLARVAMSAGNHEWACFISQQAAEKALKAVFQAHHLEGWGHVLIKLLESLKPQVPNIPETLIEAAKNLDKMYIPTRYPNGFAEGAPGQFYTMKDSDEAINHANIIIEFCKKTIG